MIFIVIHNNFRNTIIPFWRLCNLQTGYQLMSHQIYCFIAKKWNLTAFPIKIDALITILLALLSKNVSWSFLVIFLSRYLNTCWRKIQIYVTLWKKKKDVVFTTRTWLHKSKKNPLFLIANHFFCIPFSWG